MPISRAEKEEVLRIVLVELERSFFILHNHYNGPDLDRMQPFLGEIETQVKTHLADLRSKILSSTP